MSFQVEQETADPLYEWANESSFDASTPTVIRNVLLCGPKSRNGREFSSTAFGDDNRVKALYENIHVFVDHLPAEQLKTPQAAKSRKGEELAGFIKNVRLENGCPRGDIHTDGCPKGELIREFARAKVPNVGLSHVARYKYGKNSSKQIVESVEEVCSVDVVIRPATTNTFTEQTGMADVNLEVLQAENTSLKTQVAALNTQLEAEKVKVTDLDKRCVTLKAERDGFETEVTSFKQKEAVAQRRVLIEQELKTAGLNVDDSDIVSSVFVESLVAIESADARKPLIEDRAKLAKAVPATEQHRGGSGERKPAGFGGGSKPDVVKTALENPFGL